MGSFLPSAALSVLQLGFDAARKGRQANMERTARETEAQAHIERIRHARSLEDQQRQQALRRALAAQKARFGALGLGSGGSAGAVLAGLAAEAEKESNQARQIALARINEINNRLAISSRPNLFDISQPAFQSAFGLARKNLKGVQLLEI